MLCTSSNALALIDQRDQGQKHCGLRSGHQKRLGGGDEIGADSLQKSQHLGTGIGKVEVLEVPPEGQRPGQQRPQVQAEGLGDEEVVQAKDVVDSGIEKVMITEMM